MDNIVYGYVICVVCLLIGIFDIVRYKSIVEGGLFLLFGIVAIVGLFLYSSSINQLPYQTVTQKDTIIIQGNNYSHIQVTNGWYNLLYIGDIKGRHPIKWDFGDNTTSDTVFTDRSGNETMTHEYNTTGIYNVSVDVV
jgi:hypothetical protein